MHSFKKARQKDIYEKLPSFEWLSVWDMKIMLNVPKEEAKQFAKDIDALYHTKRLTRTREKKTGTVYKYRKETL